MLFDDSKTSTDWFCWQHQQQETLPLGRSADRTNSSLTWRYVAGRCCASVWNNVHGETLASLDLLPSPAHIIDMLRSLHTAQSSITLWHTIDTSKCTQYASLTCYILYFTLSLPYTIHIIDTLHSLHADMSHSLHTALSVFSCTYIWHITLYTLKNRGD